MAEVYHLQHSCSLLTAAAALILVGTSDQERDMPQLDGMLRDVEIADPAVEAVLAVLAVAEEVVAQVRAETEVLEGEIRLIVNSNQKLMALPLSANDFSRSRILLDGADAPNCRNYVSCFAKTVNTAATKHSGL
jgi:hypothetical protein